jgi:RNA polymerase sigma-70 factor (ECF subfamily)
MMSSQQKDHNSLSEQFVRLFQQCERGLFKYILSLVLDVTAADEISQNTSLLLWEEFESFDQSKDFGAWARTIAYYQVLKYRQTCGRERVQFDSELLNVLADRMTVRYDELIARQDHLIDCIAQLGEFKRQVIRLYYGLGMTTKVAAEHLGKSVAAVEKTLIRVRRVLNGCIEAAVRREDHA